MVQYGIGLVAGQWSSQDGHYPIAAYQAGFGFSAALQLAALVWFAIPWIRTLGKNLSVSFRQSESTLFHPSCRSSFPSLRRAKARNGEQRRMNFHGLPSGSACRNMYENNRRSGCLWLTPKAEGGPPSKPGGGPCALFSQRLPCQR